MRSSLYFIEMRTIFVATVHKAVTPCYTSSVFYSLHPTSFSSSSNLQFVLAFLIYVEYALQLATSPYSGSATIICIYRGMKSDLSSLHCHFDPFFLPWCCKMQICNKICSEDLIVFVLSLPNSRHTVAASFCGISLDIFKLL